MATQLNVILVLKDIDMRLRPLDSQKVLISSSRNTGTPFLFPILLCNMQNYSDSLFKFRYSDRSFILYDKSTLLLNR